MKWEALYRRQEELDRYIEEQHNISKRTKIEEKILALHVELAELANETRCFKFWSTKESSGPSVINEEYVDGLHFLLSLGLDLDYRYISTPLKGIGNITESFLTVFDAVQKFREQKSGEAYQQLFTAFLSLGKDLGLSEEDVKIAYHAKNEVNFKRQDEGY